MKAITLHQPWASLIAAGAKTTETRSWPAPKADWGSVIAIHAGKTEDLDFRHRDPDVVQVLGSEPTPKGAIVAIARIKDCLPTEHSWPGRLYKHFGDFSFGRYAWRLVDVQPLRDPLPCTGHQRLWTLPIGAVAEILDRVAPAVVSDPRDF